MAAKISDIISVVRGLIVDRLETDIDPLFTDAEIIRAINMTVGGFFGVRPEAFSDTGILTEPPALFPEINLSSWSTVVVTGFTDTSFNVTYTYDPVSAKWKNGAVSLWKDDIWYLSNGVKTFTAPDNGLDTPPMDFLDVDSDLENSSVTVDYFSVSYTMPWSETANSRPAFELAEGPEDAPIKLLHVPAWEDPGQPPRPLWLLASSGSDDVMLEGLSYLPVPYDGVEWTPGPAATSGAVVAGAVPETPGEIFFDYELAINRWAVPIFCYGVAALLLEQRSKDAFYRKAADAMQALYRGR